MIDVSVTPPAVIPGGKVTVKVTFNQALDTDGVLTVTSRPARLIRSGEWACVPTDVAKGATNASSSCGADPNAAAGLYRLTATVRTAVDTAFGQGNVEILQVGLLKDPKAAWCMHV